VLGAGRLAEAVVRLLVAAGHDVAFWARRAEVARKVAHGARVAADVEDACRGANIVCFAVPTHALADVAHRAGNVARGDQVALHACRGLVAGQDQGCEMPHQIIRRETCIKKVIALGGPLYVDDASEGRPLVAVAASRFDDALRALQSLVKGTRVRVHPTHDIIGVEIAGAVSNVSTIAAGLAAGAGLGETDQGILMTRGLVEAQRLGKSLGADPATFVGLAGVGDLIPRRVTSMRRHRELGEAIGRDGDRQRVLAAHADLEGPRTARCVADLARKMGIDLPLVFAVDDVIQNGGAPRAALEAVLSLDLELHA
jgi:glycerol-3-phosphate dehydrogenase (NAD(P)+)